MAPAGADLRLRSALLQLRLQIDELQGVVVLRWALMAVAGLLGWVAAHAGTVSVAVAANFSAPMQKIAARFEADTGHKAVLAVGSTGRFYAQIRHGAPYDVLLAADEATPALLQREGLGSGRFTYAVGRLVLWSRQGGLVDGQGAVLHSGKVGRLAVADPKLAPYGMAALEVLTRLGVRDAWQARLVLGENIAQTWQYVATGNAALGFVALSQVMVDGKLREGSAWVVPSTLHTPIRQDALLLQRAQGNPAAGALLQYLRGEQARAIIKAHGYEF